jgi:hypothetical protein
MVKWQLDRFTVTKQTSKYRNPFAQRKGITSHKVLTFSHTAVEPEVSHIFVA